MESMKPTNSRIRAVCVYIFALIIQSYSLSNFSNYQSVIRINDIAASGKQLWAASSGGLLLIDLEKYTQTFFNDSYSFPDLNLTTLAVDPKGNLWIGTKLGYLYKRSPDGRYARYDSYYGAGWGIQDIFMYKGYLVVGSSKGLGIFDPEKGISIHNTTAIDSSSNAGVNAIAVHNDSLYVGCQGSYDAFDISGDKFLTGNYLDVTLWNPTYTKSPIVSFVDSSGVLLPQASPALSRGGALYRCEKAIDSVSVFTADSQETKIAATSIISDQQVQCTIPGAVTVLTGDATGNVWIGTDENFLYCWNGTADAVQYKIAGLANNDVDRIYAAKNGTVWLLPLLARDSPSWWEGISSFDGKQWNLYNRFSMPGIGLFNGGGSDFTGICEDRNGNMWFGTSGASVRFYNTHTKQWQAYYFAGLQGIVDSVKPFSLNDPFYQVGLFWGKHDAIVQDSSGCLWVANHIYKTVIESGCLVCYNPWRSKAPSYRRFFPKNTLYSVEDIKTLCVDGANHLFVGSSDGRLLVIDLTANPIDNGIRVILDRSGLSSVTGMSATSQGVTWIATGNGLYKYRSAYASTDSALMHISSLKGAITGVASETESVIWLGTFDKGLLRYDADKDSLKIVDMTSGLVSNAIKDISIDKTNGFLWVATPDGVSRYNLGHTSVAVTDNASIIAYPNPFSFSNPNHREIVFKHCTPGAKVCIYTMSGSLVTVLTSGKDNAYLSDENGFENTLHWIPSKKIPPGAYYFIGQSQKPVKTKKLLIIP